MAAAVPLLDLLAIHQPQVGLVDQGRGLERLARLLLRQLLSRQLAQLVVDQRQQLLGGLRVALLDGRENPCHFIHQRRCPGPSTRDAVAAYPGAPLPRFDLDKYSTRARTTRLKSKPWLQNKIGGRHFGEPTCRRHT